MINNEETLKQFGYSTNKLPLNKTQLIIYICVGCKKNFQCEFRKYKENKKCVYCANSGSKLSKTELTKEIKEIIKRLGYQPSEDEFIKISNHSARALKKAFQKDTWKEILASLGYKVLRRKNDARTYEEIAEDIKRVKEKLKKIPTFSEYRANGKFRPKIVFKVTNLSKWIDIVNKVFNVDVTKIENFAHNQRRKTEFYYEKLRKLALKLGHTPTTKEANDAGISVSILKNRLKTDWPGIIKRAGLDKKFFPDSTKIKFMSNEEILDDVRRVAKILGRLPSEKEYEEMSSINFPTYKRRFGGKWIKVLESAGLYSPEVSYKSKSKSLWASDEDVFDDVRRVAIFVGKIPTKEDYSKYGQYGMYTVLRRANAGWKKVLELAQVDNVFSFENLNKEEAHKEEVQMIEIETIEDPIVGFLKESSIKSIVSYFQNNR